MPTPTIHAPTIHPTATTTIRRALGVAALLGSGALLGACPAPEKPRTPPPMRAEAGASVRAPTPVPAEPDPPHVPAEVRPQGPALDGGASAG